MWHGGARSHTNATAYRRDTIQRGPLAPRCPTCRTSFTDIAYIGEDDHMMTITPEKSNEQQVAEVERENETRMEDARRLQVALRVAQEAEQAEWRRSRGGLRPRA